MTAHYVGHQSLPPAAHAHVALANAFPRVSRSPTPQSAAAEHLPHELRLRVVELRARRARSSSATSAWSSSSTGAQDRLLKANGWLTQGLSAETLQMLYGPGGADLGLSGWQPPVITRAASSFAPRCNRSVARGAVGGRVLGGTFAQLEAALC